MEYLDPFEDYITDTERKRLNILIKDVISYKDWVLLFEDAGIYSGEDIIKRLYLLQNAIYKLFISKPIQLYDDKLLYNESLKYYQLKTSFTEDLLINFYDSLSGDLNTTVDSLLLHSKMDEMENNLNSAITKLCWVIHIDPKHIEAYNRAAVISSQLRFYRMTLFFIKKSFLLILEIYPNGGALGNYDYSKEAIISLYDSIKETLNHLSAALIK